MVGGGLTGEGFSVAGRPAEPSLDRHTTPTINTHKVPTLDQIDGFHRLLCWF